MTARLRMPRRLETKRYLVTGRRKYRWHDPGSVFEAALEVDAERRAIERGAIRVLGVVVPDVQDGSYMIPSNWPESRPEQVEVRR